MDTSTLERVRTGIADIPFRIEEDGISVAVPVTAWPELRDLIEAGAIERGVEIRFKCLNAQPEPVAARQLATA